jgi:hypothetical protein
LSVPTNIFKLYSLVRYGNRRMYVSSDLTLADPIYSSVNRQIYGALGCRYRPAYILWLINEYRRDLETERFPFSLFPAHFISFAHPPSPRIAATASSLIAPPRCCSPAAAAAPHGRRTLRCHCLVAAPSPAHCRHVAEGYFLYYF